MTSAAFTITGHRGAMATEPENTMASFRRAAQLGVDALELDVHLSRDGHLVVMHDKTLDRTTNGFGAIADTDFDTIATLDAGGGEHVPQLYQVWDAFPDLELQVEVKDAAATRAVTRFIRSHPRPAATLITSFYPEAVSQAISEDGPWTVGLIGGAKGAKKLGERLKLGADALMLHWNLADLPAVRQFREQGARADVWPCQTEADVCRAIADGWSGATVDDPGSALRARARCGAAQLR
jgi:glycerophosphoryl diester phosphodiesterase